MLLYSKPYSPLQKKRPEDFGYRYFALKFQDDPVDLIVISKKGEEKLAKPLLFYCQDCQPQPVIKYGEKGLLGTLPFDEKPFLEEFHIVVPGKPFIPIIADTAILGPQYQYYKNRESALPPKAFLERNSLDYYVYRNNFILKQLSKERWVKSRKLVVTGNAEGSSVAAKMAAVNKKVTHLIYSGGNPYGKIMNQLAQARYEEKDSLPQADRTIAYWKTVVANSRTINLDGGDCYKTTYEFSLPQKENLMQLEIPVLFAYATGDWSAAFNDLFQIETIREQKTNFQFRSYRSLEHGYYPVAGHHKPDYAQYNWEKVGRDWLEWLNTNT
ncbi:hypothetical protein [Flavobacterium kingsejongi]|uniref:Alpha/beta hydrolase n=1 Tax=Flavobacterium kingsejongi TaxID=1678728 RepID=A0A2S1LTD8_9FLAO|nr:hypothetical protein [Flavobacterium kingsejongi]AWG26968.1 hypothetical protein FK004_17875 [Flavobacterium kingsejongi]